MMTRGTDKIWDSASYWSEQAERAFAAARRRAQSEEAVDHPPGKPSGLLPFAEVRQRSGLLVEGEERTETVALDRIVGSVGKAQLFTRSFYPRSDDLRARWKAAYAVTHGLRGYEPIELYEAEGLFYVVDGHFRVSVARAIGYDTIEAKVRRWA